MFGPKEQITPEVDSISCTWQFQIGWKKKLIL